MRRAPPAIEREGIVVGKLDYGEQDRILRILTPDAGRVAVLARNARAARSRLAAVDLAARVRFQAREGELATLVSAEVLDGRLNLRRGLGRLAVAAYACELCGALAREHHGEPRLYGLLETALLLLDAAGADPGAAFVAGLEAKALTFAGVAPALDHCVRCGGPPEAWMRFAPAGLVHAHCDDGEERTIAMSADFAAALEGARRLPLREALDAPLPEGPTDALHRAACAHVGRALPSRAVLDALLH
ncbi:MAG: DNA repair protein RecO [Myxococcota bacterium]